MAKIGYAEQERRAVEHAEKRSLRDAAHELRAAIVDEERVDRVISAKELAGSIRVNGRITGAGYAFTEQAIRGLFARLGSPGLAYVLGLRERIAETKSKPGAGEQIAKDKCMIADVLAHELYQSPDTEIRLRCRNARGDIYAIVSPSYGAADAPAVIDEILGKLPEDAKGSYAYDPATTSWELRASIWTPTPVAEQAVGEPFEGYVSFTSRDNGTGKLNGGGGIVMLACLNAGTYVAEADSASRVHRGDVIADVQTMTKSALRAIDALCDAWGRARGTDMLVGLERYAGLPVSKVIPGLWWGELLDRKSELAAVLPGRSAEHVKGLSRAYEQERRDTSRITRADMAQGWTRYIQNQPGSVRRDGEAAIADWLVSRRTDPRFDAREIES